MQNTEFWLRKINALLHDPPDKPLGIQVHETQSRRWAQALSIKLVKEDFKQADWIASAADRLNFPNYKLIGSADFREKPYLTHPLSGELCPLPPDILPLNYNEICSAIERSLSDESVSPDIRANYKALFLFLWRNWSSKIQQLEPQLEKFWDLLPADTRIPDHSIWAHQALTSAIAATTGSDGIPDPAFLLLTIGPVQAFISAARRTQDLWAGSYLLSYLNWAAIEAVAEEIGPDSVVFPNLLNQPLCDRWLNKKGITLNPSKADLLLPSLPNRFLAIVPRARGNELAQKAEAAVKKQWRSITQKVRAELEALFDHPPAWAKTWERQTADFFEVYWQVYPWRPEGHPIQDNKYEFLKPHSVYLGDRLENTQSLLAVYAQADRQGGGEYPPNIGSIYSDLYFITEKALGSRKGLRNFSQVSEPGEKSTLAGDRTALYDGVDQLQIPGEDFDRVGRKKIKAFWEEFARRLGSVEIKDKGKERLDAIELTKRFAWKAFFKKELGFARLEQSSDELRFPSTSTIATASFKDAVIQRLQSPKAEALRQSLEEWINDVYAISDGNRVHQEVIPYLSAQITQRDDLLNKFLRLDGRLLFEETYQRPDEWINFNQERINKAKQSLIDFIKSAQKHQIPKPRKYFAVLMMDGDGMGQWIAGDKMPKYSAVLHPTTREQLQRTPYQKSWDSILENDRLMSPAIHGFISKALGDFSLILVRYIVEHCHPGKLVYAGGDDVLALLPVDCALKVARELRAAFSGELDTGVGTDYPGTKFEVDFGGRQNPTSRSGYVMLKTSDDTSPKLLATMGCNATASTGIVIAHRLAALDLTLQEVRQAEKNAKNQEGRNAFSITFLKRSGETMTAGAKWTYGREADQEKSQDTVAILLEFQKYFADDHISGKFPYLLREQAEILSPLSNRDMNTSEIKRLLHRQQGKQKLPEKEEENLANRLADLIMYADCKQQKQFEAEDQRKLKGKLTTFADLLVFTRFLATGEGEE